MKRLLALALLASVSVYGYETGPANSVYRVPNTSGARPFFGTMDLSKAAAVGTSILGVTNGGTGSSTLSGAPFLNRAGDTMTGGLGILGTPSSALILDANRLVTSSATSSTELGYLVGVTGLVQPQFNTHTAQIAALQGVTGGYLLKTGDTMTGPLGLSSNLYVSGATVTPTELGYLAGATANIQTQLNGMGGGGFTTPTSGSTYGNTSAPSISGTNNTAVGIGSGFAMGAGASNTLYGHNAGASVNSGTGNTVIGNGAAASVSAGNGNTVIGNGALSTAIGASGNTSIGNGAGASVNGGSNVFVGSAADGAQIGTQQSIALGAGAVADSNEFVVGSSAAPISTMYLGRGRRDTAGGGAVTIQPTAAQGTDIGGTLMQIGGGRSTGTGTGGAINFVTAPAGLTGVTLNGLAIRMSIDSAGNILVPGLTASRALILDGSKFLTSSSVTSTELGYLSGITTALAPNLNGLTANVQTQINSLASAAQPTVFRGTGTVGGVSTYTVPVNVKYLIVTVIGGGGGGGGGTSSSITPAPTAGGNGQPTYFGSSSYLQADGGTGGSVAGMSGAGGGGGGYTIGAGPIAISRSFGGSAQGISGLGTGVVWSGTAGAASCLGGGGQGGVVGGGGGLGAPDSGAGGGGGGSQIGGYNGAGGGSGACVEAIIPGPLSPTYNYLIGNPGGGGAGSAGGGAGADGGRGSVVIREYR